MRRRIVAVLLLALAISAVVVGASVTRSSSRHPRGTPPSGAPAVQAAAAVVMDARTGAVLYAKSPDRHLPMASCTKIMTALLVVEKVHDLDAFATVPRAAVGQPGAWIGLRTGERITIHNLLLGLMVRSATDCAVTLATYVSGDEPTFARLMNRRAAQLGLSDTHYSNASGIKIAHHYTSARDLAELGRVAMRDARFRDLAWRVFATVTWPPDHRVRLHSHNILNETYDWVDGIKTGASESARCCLAASGTLRGRHLIVATLREPNRRQETRDALRLFRYGASQPPVSPAGASSTPAAAS
jgi:serine-type D-Ala-D-Ala carboxypeptidase (penicillin-binding protein 5/6)